MSADPDCTEVNVGDEPKSETVSVEYAFEENVPLMVCQDASVFKGEGCYTKGCKWAPDGTCLLTNSEDNILRIWDLPQELHKFSESRDFEMSKLSFNPVLAMKEGGLIYDFCWYPLMNSWDPVSCCLASVSRDSPAHLWDAFTGQLRATYRAYNQVDEVEAARSVTFDPFGEHIYCGFNNCVRRFDIAIPGRTCTTRNLKTSSADTQNGIVSCLSVSPAIPDLYAVGTYLKTIGLYQDKVSKALCILRGHEGGLTHIKFSPDGFRLYSGGRKDSEILCWDLRDPGKILFSIPRSVISHQRIYFDLSPDGKYLLSGTTDGQVQVWDTSNTPTSEELLSSPVIKFQAHQDCTNGVSLHPHYPLVATCSGQRHYLDTDSSSDEESNLRPYKIAKAVKENKVKLWWAGPLNKIDMEKGSSSTGEAQTSATENEQELDNLSSCDSSVKKSEDLPTSIINIEKQAHLTTPDEVVDNPEHTVGADVEK